MQLRELAVPHAFEVTPILHGDERGGFLEAYRADLFADATGRTFELRQSNISVSRRGVARGIHFADVDPAPTPGSGGGRGQAKYFTVIVGSVIDYVVDLRLGSPTFGTWASVALDDQNRKAVFIPEGLGHLFVVMSTAATVNYLTNDIYRPDREHGVCLLDSAIALELPLGRDELVLSPQDAAAPTLAEAQERGLLPSWDAALARYAESAAVGSLP